MKGQAVRTFDVVVLGPFMVWAAFAARELPTWARWTLGASGVGTVFYNAINLSRGEEQRT